MLLSRLAVLIPRGNQRAISFSAFSGVSEPWQMLRPTSMAKSPRMEPGREARGLVSPRSLRPVLTASLPVQTIPTTGPESMYWIKPGKKDLLLRSQYFFLGKEDSKVKNHAMISLSQHNSHCQYLRAPRDAPWWGA